MKYCPKCGSVLTERRIGGANRAACPAGSCRFVHWDNPIPVVAALVQYEGKVVLARNVDWPEGLFSLITGYLERGESPESGVLREVQEELGLAADIDAFIGHYCISELNQLVLAYSVVAHGKLALGQELAEVRHLSRAALREWDFGWLEMTSAIVGRWLDRHESSRMPTSEHAAEPGVGPRPDRG
jgi:NAD+ diphosphatase